MLVGLEWVIRHAPAQENYSYLEGIGQGIGYIRDTIYIMAWKGLLKDYHRSDRDKNRMKSHLLVILLVDGLTLC